MDQFTQVFLAVVSESQAYEDPGIFELVADSDIIIKFVLLSLVGMSIGCWVIIFNKLRVLRHAQDRTNAFNSFFWSSKNLNDAYESIAQFEGSPLAAIFLRGYTEFTKLKRIGTDTAMMDMSDYVERALRRVSAEKKTELERMTTFLATTGSTAPFIGLFGTVWGILRAFQKIGSTGQASIQTVGPDIAHALIATAVGLAAAIPAVIAYNFINRRIRVLSQEMENFSSDFINIIKRSSLRR